MNFVCPSAADLATLRFDPILFEQELDVRPAVAQSLERALGFRAGRAYWRSKNGWLYAIELGDFGRGHPSMALVYGLYPRYEPRPVSDEDIDRDLGDLCLWIADVSDTLDPEHVSKVLEVGWAARGSAGKMRLF